MLVGSARMRTRIRGFDPRSADDRRIAMKCLRQLSIRRAVLVAASMSGLASFAGAQSGMPNVNRIANAGFEYRFTTGPDGDVPLYWSRHDFPGGLGRFTVGASEVKHGRFAVKVIDGSDSAAWGLESDPVPVEPGHVYTLRGWYRRIAGDNQGLQLRWYDAGDGLLETETTSSDSSSWTRLSLTDTAPAGAVCARVMLFSGVGAAGASLFDSVSLVLAGERVHDGAFDEATPGTLPAHWTVDSSHPGSVQEVRFDGIRWLEPLPVGVGGPPVGGGNLVLALEDHSGADSCGLAYRVPVTPETPYALSVRARKVGGSGPATVALELTDEFGTLLSSHVDHVYSSTFETLRITAKADVGAAYARIVCRSEDATIGECRFDLVSFTEDYTRLYVSPDGAGLGDGSSAANAANYDDELFWSGVVDAAALDHPVKMVMLTGEYRDHLTLNGLGNATHHTLLAGETPFAVSWSDGGASLEEYALIHDSRNYLFRHLHFTSDNVKQMQYVLRIGLIGSVGENTRDIAVQGCSFVGITHMWYGMTGAHKPATHDITWEYSSWVEIGADAPDHMIYNAYGAHDLWIHHNYFQDCGGAYVKLRDECHDVLIEDNVFVNTGTVGGTQNIYMIYSSANNSVPSYDELLSYRVTIRNNSFTYDLSTAGNRIPYILKMEGDDPAHHPGYYLISTADGDYIADTSNTPESRNAKIVDNCHIDLMGDDLDIYGNTYVNCNDTRFRFWRKLPPPGDYWVGVCDIDALLGL